VLIPLAVQRPKVGFEQLVDSESLGELFQFELVSLAVRQTFRHQPFQWLLSVLVMEFLLVEASRQQHRLESVTGPRKDLNMGLFCH
jgi:hypothetical protein